MKVLCQSGYFKFYPERVTEISRFKDNFEIELFPKKDYYTFEALLEAPNYSLDTKNYMGILSRKTFHGEPWEVFKENEMVFSLALMQMVYVEAIVTVIKPPLSGYYFPADTLLVQPGSLTLAGDRVLSYNGFLDEHSQTLNVVEFSHD